MKRWKEYGPATWYVLISVPVGLGLVYIPQSLAPGPLGDCESWDKTFTVAQRTIIINHYDHITQVGAGIMFALGLLVLLLDRSIRDKKTSVLWPLGVVFMLLCYGLVIWALSGPACFGNAG